MRFEPTGSKRADSRSDRLRLEPERPKRKPGRSEFRGRGSMPVTPQGCERMSPMLRTVSTHLELGLGGPSKLVFSLAAAQGLPLQSETLAITVDGRRVQPRELVDAQGSRLHSVVVQGSRLVLDYQATVDGIAGIPPVKEIEQIVYLRPSRYCEADSLG